MFHNLKEFILEVPIRKIEEVFGAGNFDDFGDMLVTLLNEHNSPRKYSLQWHYETSHSNPWHHTLVIKIEGTSEHVFNTLINEIERLKLMD